MEKIIIALSLCCSFLLAAASVQANMLNFTKYPLPSLDTGRPHFLGHLLNRFEGNDWREDIHVVKLRGKINHFGMDISQDPPKYIDYHAGVSGVNVWIAEQPRTKAFNITSDASGWWTMYIVKYKNVDLEFSFVYEKDGWITTKSNVITVTDEDNTDLTIQYIDPNYYNYAMKPAVEGMMNSMGYSGFTLENAMIVTVGKSWASMLDDRLPHGDPGAITIFSSEYGQTQPAIGPIYFNEAVQPDPTYTATSVDGGVTWLNVSLNNTYYVTAEKAGVTYDTVKFIVDKRDAKNGVTLYIASPPDSVEGDNDSLPGEY